MTELAMAPIFPITALSKEPREVKAAAQNGFVRITENGRGAYVFASEQALSELVARERADAAYEAYLLAEVGKGADDIVRGNYTTSRAAMFAEAARRRDAHA